MQGIGCRNIGCRNRDKEDRIRDVCDSPEEGGGWCFVFVEEFFDCEGNGVSRKET